MMRKLLFLFFLLGFFSVQSQDKETLKVYSFSEVEKLQQQNPKPIVIFISTHWCKFCHGMKKRTFKESKVTKLLNTFFYLIQLDAELKENITFLGKTFTYKPSGNTTGTHELAIELATLNGKMNYPTTTILNTKFEIDLQLDGYINHEKMKLILTNYLQINKKK